MGLSYANLDARTRDLMLEEIEHDTANGNLYTSSRLTSEGERAWEGLLREAARSGSDDSLARALKHHGYLQSHEARHSRRGMTVVRVPYTAAETLAEGEFNRFYCRAICRRALSSESDGLVLVQRAKVVIAPRPESESKAGQLIDAERLLLDLRTHPGVDTALGIPAGPNSGLSVALRPA